MEKQILLALDDSLHSKHAVQYAARMAAKVVDLKFTLLSVQPTVSLFLADEAKKDARARAALEKMKAKNAEKALTVLEGYKTLLTDRGIDASRIEVKTRTKKLGLARDILEVAEDGRYDAIVVGRRGVSKLQEMFSGSVTTNLLEHSRVIPVWVVDGVVENDRIMVAVDGSESALRAVDHLSFVFAKSTDATFTLVHVAPRLKDYCEIDFGEEARELEEVIVQGDKRCVESFMVHAYAKFTAAGIEKDRVEIRELPGSLSVGKALMAEAERGGYGTVVFGRRGVNKAFFMGSVSNYLVNKLSNRALWLIS